MPLNQVNFAGTVELSGEVVQLCTQRYNVGGNFDSQPDSQQYFNTLNVLGTNGGLLTNNSIQYNASSGAQLGVQLLDNGTTGPALPETSQQLVAINLSFPGAIATSDDPSAANSESILGSTLVDLTVTDPTQPNS